MLSLGACVVGDPQENFYVELKPITRHFDAESLAVSGLDLQELAVEGTDPVQAMQDFVAWIERVTPRGKTPVFAAYPLAFDWMFVAYYLHRFAGRNPFGYSGFDFKSYYMGVTGSSWKQASTFSPKQRFSVAQDLTHNARADAIAQAELLTRLFEFANERRISAKNQPE